MTLKEITDELNAIYREKNDREGVLTNIFGALVFISGSLKLLVDDVVKRDFRNRRMVTAHLVKRILVAVDVWGFDDFVRELARKYPISGCRYCGRIHCRCGKEKTIKATLDTHAFETSKSWSLGDWQWHLEYVYGENNRANFSPEKMALSVTAEFLEVLIAIQHKVIVDGTLLVNDEIRVIAIEETADLFARILALANFCSFSIEDVLRELYRDGCIVCKKRICVCPSHWEGYATYESMIIPSIKKS